MIAGQMNLLTQTEAELDTQLTGKRFAQALIGGFQIESAWDYDFGGTLTARIGYYNRIARYVCFIKGTLTPALKFTEQEVEACLISIAAADWGGKASAPSAAPATIRYRYTEGNLIALAWHKDDKPYVFAYVPMMPQQPAVIPNQAAIDQRFPTVYDNIEPPSSGPKHT
jgi:hypothetical protein